jgi:hypothetical protein
MRHQKQLQETPQASTPDGSYADEDEEEPEESVESKCFAVISHLHS